MKIKLMQDIANTAANTILIVITAIFVRKDRIENHLDLLFSNRLISGGAVHYPVHALIYSKNVIAEPLTRVSGLWQSQPI